MLRAAGVGACSHLCLCAAPAWAGVLARRMSGAQRYPSRSRVTIEDADIARYRRDFLAMGGFSLRKVMGFARAQPILRADALRGQQIVIPTIERRY